jgi:hypothetical protein
MVQIIRIDLTPSLIVAEKPGEGFKIAPFLSINHLSHQERFNYKSAMCFPQFPGSL